MGDTWTVQEAKAKLSEILRLARNGSPQRIGADGEIVVIRTKDWEKLQERRGQAKGLQKRPGESDGEWMVRVAPRGAEIELPSRNSDRADQTGFFDEQTEER